jgi:hypothetical protein
MLLGSRGSQQPMARRICMQQMLSASNHHHYNKNRNFCQRAKTNTNKLFFVDFGLAHESYSAKGNFHRSDRAPTKVMVS